MEVACPLYLPAGVTRAPDGVECVVVAKLTFSLDGSGWGRMARAHEPLSSDRFGPDGRLQYPSDFGLRKRACDVVVVGQVIADTATPMRLRMGRLVKDAAAPSQLGAIGRRGRDASFAPMDQRMPFPSPPLEFSLEHHAGAFAATIPGPLPSAALVYESEWRAQYPMELEVDGILLDPLRALCVLTLRGSFRAGGQQLSGALLVLDPAGRARVPTSDAASWPHYECETAPLEEPVTEDVEPGRAPSGTVRLAPETGPGVGRSTVPMSRAEALGLAPTSVGRSTVPMSRAQALGLAPTGSVGRTTQPMSRAEALGLVAADEETTQVGAAAATPPAPPIVFGAPPTRKRSSTVPPPPTSAADPDAPLPFSRPTTTTGSARPQEPVHDALPFARPGEPPRPPPPAQPIVFGDRPAPRPVAPSEPPPAAPSSSGLPFVASAPTEPVARRPMMMVGATPLGRAPIPFSRAGAKSVPPPPVPPSEAVPPDPYAEPTQDTPLAAGHQTQIGLPAVVSSAPLPFGAGPAPGVVAPPPPVPTPVAMAPPPLVPSAPALARSFGLGGGPPAPPPSVEAVRSATTAAPSRAPDLVDELLDARVLAAVLATPAPDRRAASAAKNLDDLDWTLGLARWMDALDEEAAADPPSHDALQRLMSALNEEALQARGYGART